MRILMCEWWSMPWYADIFLQRLRELGAETHAFQEKLYFPTVAGGLFSEPFRIGRRLWERIQLRYRWGPALARLNADLLQRAAELRADVVFLWRGCYIWPQTLQQLRQQGVQVVGYNNDNPFSPDYPKYFWRHLLAGLPHYNLYFAYRESNFIPYREHGCGEVDLLRACYIREIHRPLPHTLRSPYSCDIAFVGHWEADGRDDYVASLLEDPSLDLRIFGGETWKRSRLRPQLRARGSLGPARFGDDYNLVLNSTKIGLVFLSTINQDTYTRRNFEIPAAGTFMLSQYSDELSSLFREGVEAEYFRCPQELREKVQFYLKNDAVRRKIAQAGHERVHREGHEVLDRARQVMTWLRKLLHQDG